MWRRFGEVNKFLEVEEKGKKGYFRWVYLVFFRGKYFINFFCIIFVFWVFGLVK